MSQELLKIANVNKGHFKPYLIPNYNENELDIYKLKETANHHNRNLCCE
jgi:hypothetical protein